MFFVALVDKAALFTRKTSVQVKCFRLSCLWTELYARAWWFSLRLWLLKDILRVADGWILIKAFIIAREKKKTFKIAFFAAMIYVYSCLCTCYIHWWSKKISFLDKKKQFVLLFSNPLNIHHWTFTRSSVRKIIALVSQTNYFIINSELLDIPFKVIHSTLIPFSYASLPRFYALQEGFFWDAPHWHTSLLMIPLSLRKRKSPTAED